MTTHSEIYKASKARANERTEQVKQKLKNYRQSMKEQNIYAQGKAAGAATQKRGK